MKKRITFGFLIVLILSGTNTAQTPMISSGAEFNTFINSDLSYLEEKEARYAKVEGSPYIDETFKPGTLVYKNKLYTNLKLRYNYYEGYFEFKAGEEVKYYDPRYTEVDTVWLENDKYIYIEREIGNRVSRNYMKLLFNGSVKVLSFMEFIMLDPQEAKGYEEAKPAKFDPRPEVLYVQFGDDPAVEFRNRRSIDEVFPDHINELEKYAKSEKLRFRNPGDLVTLVKYYSKLD